MKFRFQKQLALILSLALFLSSLICNIAVPASAESTNLLSGLVPYTFITVNAGTTTFSWTDMYVDSTSNAHKGYDTGTTDAQTRTGDIAGPNVDYWASRVATMTDGDDNTGCYTGTVNAGKDILIAYEIPTTSITGFSMKGLSSLVDVDFYVSSSMSTLFSNKVTNVTPEDEVVSADVSESDVSFVGFRINGEGRSIITEISVFGNDSSSEPEKTNVLSGLTPYTFITVNAGTTTFSWTDMYVDSTSNAHKGYDTGTTDAQTRTGDIAGPNVDYWASRVATMTDGDDNTGCYTGTVNAGKDILIAYEIPTTSITGFSMKGLSSLVDVDFYVSSSMSTLFSNKVTNVTPEDEVVSADVSESDVSFVGFRINGEGRSIITEISVFGKTSELLPVSGDTSIISGLTPTAFMAVADGAVAYDGKTLRGPAGEYGFNGYDKTASSSDLNTVNYNVWAEYVAKLTDGSTKEGFLLCPDSGEDILITYEIPQSYLKNFSIEGIACDSIDFYASDSYDTLFDNRVITTVPSDSTASAEFTVETAKFVGFRFNACNCDIKEISLYGENIGEIIDAPNVLKGALPKMYSAVNKGQTVYNWTQVRYGVGDKEYLYGYDLNLNDSSPTRQQTRFDTWKSYVTNLTDDDEKTGLYVCAERYWLKDNVAIVYEIPETVIEGFSFIIPGYDEKNIDVYASNSYTDLFEKKVDSIHTTRSIIRQTKRLDVRATYIAIILIDPNYTISEISFFGNEYVRPNYGTNLIAGMYPSQLFVAEREYPLPHTGAHFNSYSDWKDDRLVTLTDGEFGMSYTWSHEGNSRNVTKDSLYKVISYDLGSVCQIDKVLIDSQCGGYDIFVSNDYTGLFDPEKNRVYTSGGDNLLPDGSALDPQYDLEPGENVIDVSGASGRYVGIVVTRGSRLDKAIYEACYITEIQIFGTEGNSDYGENLLIGKTPTFIYRAKYGKYEESLGELSIQGQGASVFTDGDRTNIAKILFPNNGGKLAYSYGAAVLVYYLEGKCDVNAFSFTSRCLYAPGGLDVYVSDAYSTLFEEDNRIFATGGEIAEDGVYDNTKDLGAITISAALDSSKSGRYVAFVATRVNDSLLSDGWGQLYIKEIELFGNLKEKETLPSTIVKNGKVTADFLYTNPDDCFKFAAKGINSIKLRSVSSSVYQSETFASTLARNNLSVIGDAFYIEFIDKDGKVIPYSDLSDETVRFKFEFENDKLRRLAEIRDDSVYVIKQAEQRGNTIIYKTDELDKLLIFVGFAEQTDDVLHFGAVLPVKTIYENDYSSSDYKSSVTDYRTIDKFFDEGFSDGSTDVSQSDTQEKKRRWVSVDVDDPFEWFWNICDTFKANIWMLIVCIGTLLFCAGAIVLEIMFIKKRRNAK